jgi:light-regulated signal transduction histidine kinase (bacteriophytochrome)
LPGVLGDELQLGQVFQNLIGNALKFKGKEAPKVHVGVSQDASHWVIAVKDNGIGIEPKYFERVFMLFQRLHGMDEYPGTGIGLAICKKVIERHGGRIWVESAPGEGSSFLFTLPRMKDA